MRRTTALGLAASTVLLCPAALLGHAGHTGDGVTAGLAHPLLGIDHLLAMLAVGLWAVQLGGRARWLLPVAFLAAMSVGGLLALAGVHLPIVEGGIVASVLVLGLALLVSLRLNAGSSAAIVAACALFHGHAHGVEMPAGASAAMYAAGFLLATAALILAGQAVGLGLQADRRRPWLRTCGAAITTAAVLILVGIV